MNTTQSKPVETITVHYAGKYDDIMSKEWYYRLKNAGTLWEQYPDAPKEWPTTEQPTTMSNNQDNDIQELIKQIEEARRNLIDMCYKFDDKLVADGSQFGTTLAWIKSDHIFGTVSRPLIDLYKKYNPSARDRALAKLTEEDKKALGI